MLRIERAFNNGVVFSLSGRIDAESVGELRRLLSLETAGYPIALNLQEVTMVGRDAVRFLAQSESEGVELKDCPAYIRGWINAERGGAAQ
jgi:anti-anti-sigma regulatory factor